MIGKFGALLCAASLFVAAGAQAQGKQDFTLVNSTGYVISEVYVAPSSSDDWENDILGSGLLDEGVSVPIHFERGAKTCKWDLKVVYKIDNSKAVWSNIDLCEISKITIKYNKSTDTTSASFD